MKEYLMVGVMALTAIGVGAAEPKDEVKAAANKLAQQTGYSWVQSLRTEGGGGGGARGAGGATEGKIGEGGFMWLSLPQGDSATEAIIKGGKVVIKTGDGWKSLDELRSGGEGGLPQRNRGALLARRVGGVKAPAVEAEELLSKMKTLTKAEGAYAGDFSEEAAKEMLLRGRRPGVGGEAMQPTEVKGSAKFWVKDGVLSKYEYNVQGKWKSSRDGQDIERVNNRTTTVEIKDLGTTKLEVPEEAKKKLS